jgi:hypothetical protein
MVCPRREVAMSVTCLLASPMTELEASLVCSVMPALAGSSPDIRERVLEKSRGMVTTA